ncbi:MAG: prepilin-type N-terminal cleavage/methylation domain-containing protein [Acidobacteriota bacterium]
MREKNYQPAPGKTRETGFSVIEVLIAIVVLSVGLVSIVAVSAYISRSNNISNHKNVLGAAAQDQVDRLRSTVWSRNSEHPTVSIGGALTTTTAASAGQNSTTPYLYTLDPNNPHHATIANTPIGDLDVSWVVRQGGTADMRYVTIKILQMNPIPQMRNGMTVTTILTRQD